VYEAMVIVLAGVIIYAFIKAHRESAGQVPPPRAAAGTAPQAGGAR
jgi:hypothetical protein